MTTYHKIKAYLDKKGFVFTKYPSKKGCTSADNYTGIIGAIKYVVSRSSFDKTDPNYTLGKFIKDLVTSPFISRYNAITGEQLPNVIPKNATHKELMEICTAKVNAMLEAKRVDENSELRIWYDDWSQINITANGQLVICSSNPFNC